MNKVYRLMTATALVGLLVPGITLASNEHHGTDRIGSRAGFGDHDRGLRLGFFTKDRDASDERSEVKNATVVTGSITSITTDGFVMLAKDKDDGTVLTVITTDASLRSPFVGTIVHGDLVVGNKIWVRGVRTDSTINAKVVFVTPANTHPVAARGTVTAVNGNSFTVLMNHFGIPVSTTVTTNTETDIVKAGTPAKDATIADVAVGAKVTVKGLWDEVRSVLNAINIRIR